MLPSASDSLSASTGRSRALPLQSQSEHRDVSLVVVAGQVRGQPFAAQFALELQLAVQLVDKIERTGIAVVLARAADIGVAVAGEPQGGIEPGAEGVVDLDAELVGEH